MDRSKSQTALNLAYLIVYDPEKKPVKISRDVYAERDAYAAEHGYDPDRIYADLKRRESKGRLRRVKEGSSSLRVASSVCARALK